VLLFSVWLCFFVRDNVRASSRKPLRLASRLAMVSTAAAGGSG